MLLPCSLGSMYDDLSHILLGSNPLSLASLMVASKSHYGSMRVGLDHWRCTFFWIFVLVSYDGGILEVKVVNLDYGLGEMRFPNWVDPLIGRIKISILDSIFFQLYIFVL